MTDLEATPERVNHAQRLHELEEQVNALTKRVRRLERRTNELPPPPSPMVDRVKKAFAFTPDKPVMTMLELSKVARVTRPSIHRIVDYCPDVLIRGRLVPAAGLRGRPAIVIARTPRRGEVRPTHTPEGAEIFWDPEP